MRKRDIFCLLLLILAVLTVFTACKKPQTDTDDDAITVSTTAELISSIAPDAHIIMKSGTYNFSELTEEDIAKCGGYVNPEHLEWGAFTVYNAPGLILEAEKSGSVHIVTESGYVDVMTMVLCDGAKLKGLVMGHKIEKGYCDSNVLKLSTSQSVTVEDCSLFGCGTYGIKAEDSALLNVIGTEIYECTDGIFEFSETSDVVFDKCTFRDNGGMFFMKGETDVTVKNTEISNNQDVLIQGYYDEFFDTDNIRIAFQDCVFSGNTKMGLPEDWPCADFKDCDFSSTSSVVSAETAYSDLIERYRSMAADPYSFTDPKNEGEKNFLEISKEMSDDMQEKAVDWYGYAIMDINDDGVEELVIGATGDYSVYVNALFTLENGKPKQIFAAVGDDRYSFSQDGTFFYDGGRSASEYGKGVYRLSDDGTKLVCEKFCFTRILDGDAWDDVVYCNKTGSWEIEDSQKADMTLDEFLAWTPDYKDLPTIPFSAES